MRSRGNDTIGTLREACWARFRCPKQENTIQTEAVTHFSPSPVRLRLPHCDYNMFTAPELWRDALQDWRRCCVHRRRREKRSARGRQHWCSADSGSVPSRRYRPGSLNGDRVVPRQLQHPLQAAASGAHVADLRVQVVFSIQYGELVLAERGQPHTFGVAETARQEVRGSLEPVARVLDRSRGLRRTRITVCPQDKSYRCPA